MATVKYLYTGDGSAFFNDIPARALSDEDWDRLSPEQQATVKASPLYRAAPARAAEKAPETPQGAPVAPSRPEKAG